MHRNLVDSCSLAHPFLFGSRRKAPLVSRNKIFRVVENAIVIIYGHSQPHILGNTVSKGITEDRYVKETGQC